MNFSGSAAGRKVVVIGLMLIYRATIPSIRLGYFGTPPWTIYQTHEHLTRSRAKGLEEFRKKVSKLWSSSEAQAAAAAIVSQKPTGGSHTPL